MQPKSKEAQDVVSEIFSLDEDMAKLSARRNVLVEKLAGLLSPKTPAPSPLPAMALPTKAAPSAERNPPAPPAHVPRPRRRADGSNTIRETVIEFFRHNPGPHEIPAIAKGTNIAVPSVKSTLQSMVDTKTLSRPSRGLYVMDNAAASVRNNDYRTSRDKIVDCLQGRILSVPQIVEAMPEASESFINRCLSELTKEGKISRVSRGFYRAGSASASPISRLSSGA